MGFKALWKDLALVSKNVIKKKRKQVSSKVNITRVYCITHLPSPAMELLIPPLIEIEVDITLHEL